MKWVHGVPLQVKYVIGRRLRGRRDKKYNGKANRHEQYGNHPARQSRAWRHARSIAPARFVVERTLSAAGQVT